MYRITQIIRNLFLRIEAFFSVFIKNTGNFLKTVGSFFAGLFGFTESQYFLDSDEAQTTKRVEPKPTIQAKQDNNQTTTNNRRSDKNKKIDDYFLRMARDVQRSEK